MPTRTSLLGHIRRAQRDRGTLAFTLLEAVVVMVVLSILIGIAAVAFTSTQRRQADLAGYPLLGAAQAEARKVASENGYAYPTDFAARMVNVDFHDNAKFKNAELPDGHSLAPESTNGQGYQVSTARGSATIMGMAVMTTPGHCIGMIDETSTAEVDEARTRWAYVENEADPRGTWCKPQFFIACKDKASADAEAPAKLTIGQTCFQAQAPLKPAPKCLIAEVTPAVAPATTSTSVSLRWQAPADTDDLDGYTIHRYDTDTVDATAIPEPGSDMTYPETGSGQQYFPASATTATISGLTAGKTYTWGIKAHYGTVPSGLADLASVQKTLPLTVMVPAKPATFTTQSLNEGVALNWSAVSGAARYEVWRSTVGVSPTDKRIITYVDATSGTATYDYTDMSVNPGVQYSYAIAPLSNTATVTACGAVMTSGGRGELTPQTVGHPMLPAPVLDGKIDDNDTNDVLLSWTQVSGAQGYKVYNGATLVHTATSGSTLSFTHKDQKRGTIQKYTVEATSGPVVSGRSNEVAVPVPVLAPVLTGSTSGGQHTLSWKVIEGADSYQLYRGDEMAIGVPLSSTGLAVGATMTAAETRPAGTRDTYYVRATATSTQIVSPDSNKVDLYVGLAAPVLTGKTDLTKLENTLTWTQIAGATGYELYRNGVLIPVTLSGTTLTYVDGGRTAGATDTYHVKALNSTTSVSSPDSNKVNLSASLSATTLVGKTINDDDNVLNWDRVEGATGYRVYRDGTVVHTVTDGAILTWTDMDRPRGLTSKYTVTAVLLGSSPLMESSHSNAVNLTIKPRKPVISVAENALCRSCNDALIQWSALPGATQYKVYRLEGPNRVLVYAGGTPEFRDPNRPWGSASTYQVTASNGAGESEGSDTRQVRALPGHVSNTWTQAGHDFIDMYWNPVPGADGYRVYIDGVHSWDVCGGCGHTRVGAYPGSGALIQVFPYNSSGTHIYSQERMDWSRHSSNKGYYIGHSVNVRDESSNAHYGSFIIHGIMGYCMDLQSRGPDKGNYWWWERRNDLQKQTRYGNPFTIGRGLALVNGPWLTPEEHERTEFALAHYGDIPDANWDAAVAHLVRVHTTGDWEQQNRANIRWADARAQYGHAGYLFDNIVWPRAHWWRGPYRMDVEWLGGAPRLGQTGTVRIWLRSAATNAAIPDAPIATWFDSATNSAAWYTNGAGYRDVPYRPLCAGTLTMQAWYLGGADVRMRVAWPQDVNIQRMVMAGNRGNPYLGAAAIGIAGGDVRRNPLGDANTIARAGTGKLRVHGWAFDPDTDNPLEVHVWAWNKNGAPAIGTNTGVANLVRTDVQNAYAGSHGVGANHGYDKTIDLPAGVYGICVYGINAGNGTDHTVECADVDLR